MRNGRQWSGKSSLVTDVLTPALRHALNGADESSEAFDRIEGLEYLDKIIDIDQSPIGRTPRSNPATYVKVFDEIRNLFAKLPESKRRGYPPGRSVSIPREVGVRPAKETARHDSTWKCWPISG